MRKADLNNLITGSKVMDKRNNNVLEVVGLEGGKYILSNGKCYTESTMVRWFDLAPVEEKPVEEKPEQPIKPTTTEEKTVVDENHEEHTGEANSKVIEGENSILTQFNKVLDDHNCYFKQYKQYIGVLTPRKKGTLLQLRKNREGNINIDIKKCIWEKLKVAYKIK